MSSLNEIMMKGMNKIMLDCEEATLLATRAEFEKVGCVKKIQMKMHIMSCKFCRAFMEQSRYITSQIKIMSTINEHDLEHHLTEEQKNRISKNLEKQINNH